jgi:hypothetical protein
MPQVQMQCPNVHKKPCMKASFPASHWLRYASPLLPAVTVCWRWDSTASRLVLLIEALVDISALCGIPLDSVEAGHGDISRRSPTFGEPKSVKIASSILKEVLIEDWDGILTPSLRHTPQGRWWTPCSSLTTNVHARKDN